MGKPSKKYKKEAVLIAIKGSHGIISTIAKTLGCDWHTADKLVKKWAETVQAMNDENETMKDFAEGKLFKNIEKGDAASIKWYLSKKAKDRGYGDESLEEKVNELIDKKIEIVNDFALSDEPDTPEEETPQNEA